MANFWWITCRHQLAVKEGSVLCNHVKNIESQFVVYSNVDAAAASLLNWNGKNIETSDKKYIVTNIEFKGIVPPIKNYFCH